VEAEKIHADSELCSAIETDFSARPVKEYICRVFIAFASEACQLSWPIDKIDVECWEFLCHLVRDAYDRGYHLFSKYDFLGMSWDQLRIRVKREFEGTPALARYRDFLLKAAEAHAGGPASPAMLTEAKKVEGQRYREPQKLTGRNGRRGPTPNMERHRAIAGIVNPYGTLWKEESNLVKIAGQLDKSKIPASPAWARRQPAIRSWARALQMNRDLVIKAIEYSLKRAVKQSEG
jgi:hypothetical protein